MSFRSIVAPAVNCRRYRYHPRTMKKLRPAGRRSSQESSPRKRLTAEGEIHVALDEASVHAACDRLEAEGVEAVAIMFLHSYVNPAHETRTREIVHERLPRAFVTASHELSREYREFERCSTVVANAYIGPVVSEYVRGIDERLKQSAYEGSFLRSEEHTSELQSLAYLVCRLLLEKKKHVVS